MVALVYSWRLNTFKIILAVWAVLPHLVLWFSVFLLCTGRGVSGTLWSHCKAVKGGLVGLGPLIFMRRRQNLIAPALLHKAMVTAAVVGPVDAHKR